MNIIFVCHGNICRSVAAEYIAKDLDKENKHVFISRATSFEEIGNDIYPPMKNELARRKIPFSHHSATKINQYDYDWADIIYYMDDENKYSLRCMFVDTKEKMREIIGQFPEASAVDMESCAIAQTCYINNVKFISFRVVSDIPLRDTDASQYHNFWDTVAENSFQVTKTFVESLKA